ncbi:hypothetical protein AMTRI_Chr09g43090 [Amborella trichopoda]
MLAVFPYWSLVVYAAVSVATSFLVNVSRLPVRVLEGIHTYIHPDNVGGGGQGDVRAAIRSPGTEKGNSNLDGYKNLSSSNNAEPNLDQRSSQNTRKKKDRGKENFEFDENNAQIFRLRLVDGHLQTRVYFTEYQESVLYSFLGLSSLLVHRFLPLSDDSKGDKLAPFFLNGSIVPILLGLFALFKLSLLLLKLSSERSASKRSEKQLSILSGILGFILALLIIWVLSPRFVDFNFWSLGDEEIFKNERVSGSWGMGFAKFLLALYAGCICGSLFPPSLKYTRSFWMGTDQLHWNLSVVACRKLPRVLLYISFLMTIFTSVLWINPMADVLVKNNNNSGSPEKIGISHLDSREFGFDERCSDKENGRMDGCLNFGKPEDVERESEGSYGSNAGDGDGDNDKIHGFPTNEVWDSDKEIGEMATTVNFAKTGKVERESHGEGNSGVHVTMRRESFLQNLGMPPSSYGRFRVICLLASAILQLLLLRTNVQMFLDEGVLSWYQRLHSSKVPDLDFSRAKIFLHNHYICYVVLQLSIPPMLVLLSLGLSEIKGSISPAFPLLHGFASFAPVAALFMAWWVVFVSAFLICLNLALYRFGFQYIF